jgi:hypothetical protein
MDELIARLENATEGSSDLSWAIAEALGWSKMWSGMTIYLPPGETEADYDAGNAEGACGAFPAYTTSIDAALTLVPSPSWDHIQLHFGPPGAWSAEVGYWHIGDKKIDPLCEGHHQTPALALCIAALRARQGATP